MIKLMSPADAKKVKSLKIGDRVHISGIIVTGRDEVHKYLFHRYDKKYASILKDKFIYHSGPIVKKIGRKYKIVSCGPTTSIREEPYQANIINKYGVKGIIGKGGMGSDTLSALKEHGGVYMQAPGGAAALLAGCIKEVIDVHFLDMFGTPEAMWVLRVEDFPAVVTMDSKGKSLHDKVLKDSAKNYNSILKGLK